MVEQRDEGDDAMETEKWGVILVSLLPGLGLAGFLLYLDEKVGGSDMK